MWFLNLFRNRSYNKPENYRTWVSQWYHQGFIWGWYSYEKYTEMQDKAWKNYH